MKALALLVILIASQADASLLCARKSGAVHVREACKPTEVAVDFSPVGIHFSTSTSARASTLSQLVSVSSLHVLDGGNQDLGFFIGTDGPDYQTIVNGLGVIANFSVTSRQEAFLHISHTPDGNTLFTGSDCTGDIYLRASNLSGPTAIQGIFYVDPFTERYARVTPGSVLTTVETLSAFSFGNGDAHCNNNDEVVDAYPMEEIVLPFTAPVWPVHVESIQ